MIKFKELNVPLYRLAAGAVLVSPKDERFLRVYDGDLAPVWVGIWDYHNETPDNDTSMDIMIGDGEGWMVLP